MRGEVFAIAYCETAEQYYRLKLDRDEQTILDFSISRKKAVRLTSVSRGQKMTTNARLRACPVCGNRIAAHCDCLIKALPCEKNIGFRFPCVYCRRLKILGIEQE